MSLDPAFYGGCKRDTARVCCCAPAAVDRYLPSAGRPAAGCCSGREMGQTDGHRTDTQTLLGILCERAVWILVQVSSAGGASSWQLFTGDTTADAAVVTSRTTADDTDRQNSSSDVTADAPHALTSAAAATAERTQGWEGNRGSRDEQTQTSTSVWTSGARQRSWSSSHHPAAAAVADYVHCTRQAGWRFASVYTALVAWHSGRTSVSGRRTFPILRLTCS